MSNTPVTKHAKKCAKILNEALQTTAPSTKAVPQPMRTGYEAVFELLAQPWVDLDEELADWREGYETCIVDVLDAIADEWGIALPRLSAAAKEA